MTAAGGESTCRVWPTPAMLAWLAASLTETHVLPSGRPIMVRPLLYSDAGALAHGFELLSDVSRRLRFFNPPEHLSPRMLEYLTTLDYDRHYALAAFAADEPGTPGVGVARWIRLAEDPTKAEVAVTVLDAYQRRGIGTLLLVLLAARAAEKGVGTLVAGVLWENAALLADLKAAGARVVAAEPGVARVELDLAPGPAEREHLVRRLARSAAHFLPGDVAATRPRR
jgi:GNAT superfamily N-acetyltransferase